MKHLIDQKLVVNFPINLLFLLHRWNLIKRDQLKLKTEELLNTYIYKIKSNFLKNYMRLRSRICVFVDILMSSHWGIIKCTVCSNFTFSFVLNFIDIVSRQWGEMYKNKFLTF